MRQALVPYGQACGVSDPSTEIVPEGTSILDLTRTNKSTGVTQCSVKLYWRTAIALS